MTAFTWVQQYLCPAFGFVDSDEVSVGSSWLTRFLVPLCLLCRLAYRRYVVALPPSSWGTLALRVNVLDEDAGLFSVRGDVEELYVTRMVGEFEVVHVEKLVATIHSTELRDYRVDWDRIEANWASSLIGDALDGEQNKCDT